jgi:hypothetical protein
VSSYELWKVVATRMGQYDQILREEGEVFELLANADGSYTWREDWVPKRDAQGREIPDEGEWVEYRDKEGNPVHTDFAPDTGDHLMKRGPMKGETVRFGWMRRVPDETPCGLYPPGADFWPPDAPQATPVRRVAAKQTGPAPIRGSASRPRREAP